MVNRCYNFRMKGKKKKNKQLSESAIAILSTPSTSGATISYPPGTMNITQRGDNPHTQPAAEIIAENRDEFSLEYIAPNKNGKDILKSDRFERTGQNTYREVEKKDNPHHHIEGDDEMNDRLDSIISIESKGSN